jgi:hypothetical protein
MGSSLVQSLLVRAQPIDSDTLSFAGFHLLCKHATALSILSFSCRIFVDLLEATRIWRASLDELCLLTISAYNCGKAFRSSSRKRSYTVGLHI